MAEIDMNNHSDRMQILEMIEKGRITASEGLRLLQTLNEVDSEPIDSAEESQPGLTGETIDPSGKMLSGQEAGLDWGIPLPAPTLERPVVSDIPQAGSGAGAVEGVASFETRSGTKPDHMKWKNWWTIPLWIGVAVTVFGGIFMYLAQRSSGIGLWFVCAAVPFTLGLVMVILAWQSRQAPWLHLRVRQPAGEWPDKVAVSLPLPVGPAAWFFRTFGKHIRGLEGQNLDQIIQAVGEKTSPDNPISIHVDDPDSGEKVDIYIG